MNGPRRIPFPSLPQRPPPADHRPSSIARRKSMARPTTEKVGAPDGWRSKAQGLRMVAGEGGDNGAAGTPLAPAGRAAGPFGARGRAATAQQVPRSLAAAGRRRPGGTSDEQQQRDSRCPAHACLPGDRALRRQGDGGDDKAGHFPGVGGRPPGLSRSGKSGDDGTAGAPLTGSGRVAGRRGARGRGGDDKAGRFPGDAGRLPGFLRSRNSSNDGIGGAPLAPAGRVVGRRSAGRRRRRRSAAVPRSWRSGAGPPMVRGEGDGRGRARPACRGWPGGPPPRLLPRLRVPGTPGAPGGGSASIVVVSPRNAQLRGDTTTIDGEPALPGRRPAGAARRSSRLSGSGGGAGLAHARSGPAGGAGVRWRPDQNGIRYPAPLLPAHQTRLRHSSSPRVSGKGPRSVRGPARAGAPPLSWRPALLGERTNRGNEDTVAPNRVLVWPRSHPGAARRRRSARPRPPHPCDGACSPRSQGCPWSGRGARSGPGGCAAGAGGRDRAPPRTRPGPREARRPIGGTGEPPRFVVAAPPPGTPAARHPAGSRKRGTSRPVVAETPVPQGSRRPAGCPERGTCRGRRRPSTRHPADPYPGTGSALDGWSVGRQQQW